jgi:hypothetical protein
MTPVRIRMVAILSVAAALLALAGCATQPHPNLPASPPGFFSALLHGFLAPFALVAGILFDVRIYAYPNTGWWYDLGFLIGLMPWGGGAAVGARR